MAFSFDDVLKEAGIEDIDYINKSLLAEHDVVFCITAIDDVEVINSSFDADRQWRFTILTRLSTGDTRKYFVSFPYNPKRRDTVVVAVQNKLKELQTEGHEVIVHSLHLVAKQQAKYANPYYKLEGVTEDGKPMCTCSITEATDNITSSTKAGKPRSTK